MQVFPSRGASALVLAALVLPLLVVPAAAQAPRAPFSTVFAGPVNNAGITSGGAAWGDCDGDGDDDLFVANMGNFDNSLFINQGDGRLVPAPASPATGDGGQSSGASWADFDNDGRLDLFVANQMNQDDFLYRNVGGCAFERVGDAVPATAQGDGYTAAWADFDNDGLVDLFVPGNRGQRSHLYRNLGRNGFGRVSAGPLGDLRTTAYSPAWGDMDGDGDQDLFIATEGADDPNLLFRNLGDGRFEQVAEGPVADDAGVSSGGSWGDHDNDGDLDLFVSNGGYYGPEAPGTLYENLGRGTFRRVQGQPLTDEPRSGQTAAWGDYDNDGDLDLAQCAYRRGVLLYRNDGAGAFTRIERGVLVNSPGYAVSCTWADFDRDGRLDLMTTAWENQNDLLWRNEGREGGWLALRLEGTSSNRAALGARVTAQARIGGRAVTQTREISGQTGSRGQSSLEVHLGLGDAAVVERLHVRWPSGRETVLRDVAANQFLAVREGEGIVAASPARSRDDVVTAPNATAAIASAGLDGLAGLLDRAAAARTLDRGALELLLAFIEGGMVEDGEPTLAAYALIARHFPASSQAAFGRAEMLRALGRVDEAAALYGTVLALVGQEDALPERHRRVILATARRYAAGSLP